MLEIIFKRAGRKMKALKVEERLEKKQQGFIVILLMLVILLFAITPAGCATLLAVLTGTEVAAAP